MRLLGQVSPATVRQLRMLAIGVGALLSCCRSAPPPSPDFGRTPVLLVHGLGETAAIWERMRRGLEARGYPADYLMAIDLAPSGGANSPAATGQVAPAVEQLLAQATAVARVAGATAPTKVDIVAHSMGALAARYYAVQVRPDRVQTLLTLAGANHGSDRFCPPADPPGARELCPAFATRPPDGIQVLLNGTAADARDETPYGLGEDPPGRPSIRADSARHIRYGTIDAEREEWIVPDSSTRLAGTGGWDAPARVTRGARQDGDGRFVIERTDHDAIVRNRATVELVAALLAEDR